MSNKFKLNLQFFATKNEPEPKDGTEKTILELNQQLIKQVENLKNENKKKDELIDKYVKKISTLEEINNQQREALNKLFENKVFSNENEGTTGADAVNKYYSKKK